MIYVHRVFGCLEFNAYITAYVRLREAKMDFNVFWAQISSDLQDELDSANVGRRARNH